MKIPASATACSQSGIQCRGNFIFGNGSGLLNAASAITPTAYGNLVVGVMLSQVLSTYGSPASKSSVETLLGPAALASLAKSQPAGDSCAFYLDGSARSTTAYQLCFNGAGTLAQKAIVTLAPA